MKPVIALFDFDDTLITRDSLMDLFFRSDSFSLSRRLINGVRFLPIFIWYKAGRITNSQGKERLIGLFLRGMKRTDFASLCARYTDRLDRLVRPEALNRLTWHQQRGDTVIVISASAEDWLAPWAVRHNVDSVIATKLAVNGERLTGKFATPNCFGPEKVVRFLAAYPDRGTYEIYAYGDGHSDQDMFSMADHAYEGRFE